MVILIQMLMTCRYLAGKLSLINIRLFVIKHVNIKQCNWIKLFLIHSKAERKDKTINPWELPCCLFSKLSTKLELMMIGGR